MLEQTAVSGSERSVKEEVMSRMATYQKAKAALEAAQAACVTGAECELELLDKATADFEAQSNAEGFGFMEAPRGAL